MSSWVDGTCVFLVNSWWTWVPTEISFLCLLNWVIKDNKEENKKNYIKRLKIIIRKIYKLTFFILNYRYEKLSLFRLFRLSKFLHLQCPILCVQIVKIVKRNFGNRPNFYCSVLERKHERKHEIHPLKKFRRKSKKFLLKSVNPKKILKFG